MRMDIKSIKDYLVNKDQRAANILSMKNSPRVLNPNGKMIYDIIGGDKFIADNRQLLIDKIKYYSIIIGYFFTVKRKEDDVHNN